MFYDYICANNECSENGIPKESNQLWDEPTRCGECGEECVLSEETHDSPRIFE